MSDPRKIARNLSECGWEAGCDAADAMMEVSALYGDDDAVQLWFDVKFHVLNDNISEV